MVGSWFFRRSDKDRKEKAASNYSSRDSSRVPSREGSDEDSLSNGGMGPKVLGPMGSDHSGLGYLQQPTRDARYADLKYTKFTITNLQSEGEKHAVFIPDSMVVGEQVFKEICEALGKQAPSMLLSGMSSARHTSQLSNPQLRQCQGFEQIVKEAKSSMKDGQGNLVEIMDKLLEKWILTAVSCVNDAAQRTNAWTYSGPQLTNFEMFLQRLINGGRGQLGTFHMVAAHMQDKAYMECHEAKQLMKKLFENSQPMSSEGVSYFQPINLKDSLWDPGECKTNDEFSYNGFDHWSFDAYDQKLAAGHPTTLWPWPHANLFFFFYREKLNCKPGEAEWKFKTRTKLDIDSVPFDPDKLAPRGYVVFGAPAAGASIHAKKTILKAMKTSRPVVLMDNTPNMAKQLCLCVNTIKKVLEPTPLPLAECRLYLDDVACSNLSSKPTSRELIEALSASKILNYVNESFNCSGMDSRELLTLSDIVSLLDVAKKRPKAFRETVCVLNPLTQHKESVAHLVATFMSHQSGLKEANTTTVHHSLVLKAWGLHLKLTRNEQQLRRLMAAIEVPIALAFLISICMCMVLVSNLAEESFMWHPPHWLRHAVSMLLVSLPIAVALLTILRNNFEITAKWAEVHMAASKVTREIYYFLGNVGPYKPGSGANQKRFLSRLKKLSKRASGPWLRDEDLNASWEKDFREDPERLQNYVNSALYGTWPRSACCQCRCMRGCFPLRFPWTRLRLDEEPADMAAPVTAETYMEFRIVPLKNYYAHLLKSMRRSRILLNVVLVLLLGGCMALGAIGAPLLIPIVLCLAALVALVLYWVIPSDTERVLEDALDKLSEFVAGWHGTALMTNRTMAMKVHFITQTEDLALRVARSLSPSALLPELVEGDDEGLELDAADIKAWEANRIEQHAKPIAITIASA